MNWLAVGAQLGPRLAAGREWLRARLRPGPVALLALLALVLFAFAVSTEALVRARLVPSAERVPTALYTRPVAWDGRPADPVVIGNLRGGTREWRIPVSLDEVPPHLIDAVLAVEDQRFFDHEGIDFKRIAGAFVANIKAGGVAQGGSTITQQLVKNLHLSARRTPLRKVREAAIATVLEQRYDKRQILEAYLNEIYLGHDRGVAIHGVGAASRFYFGKDVRQLVLSEAATLAAMIKAPNRLAPHRHPVDLKARRDLVLSLMAEQGRIPARARDQSSAVRVPTKVHPLNEIDARWFADYVREGVPSNLPPRGMAVYTTLDARLQQAAERAVRGYDGKAQVALVALDPRNGDVLAMVGGRDYGKSQFNRAVDARRQPGSAFKPIVALAALEPHRDAEPEYTLASVVHDAPLSVSTPQGVWQPANYDGSYRGDVTLRYALEQSLNTPFARLGVDLGPERIVATARRMGITSKLQPVPSIALGASEVSLLELTRAYGVLASNGNLAATRRLVGTAQVGGELEAVTRVSVERVTHPGASFLVTSALQGAVSRGTGRGLGRQGVAGKTGTSNDWRDGWFIAYTPEIAVGVWVGNDNGESIRQSGGAVAVPIAARFFSQARISSPGFEPPTGVVRAHLGNGDWFSPCGDTEYFLEGTEPPTGGCWSIDDDDEEWWGNELARRAAMWLRQRVSGSTRDLR